MSAPRDLDQQLESFLVDGPMELPEPSYAQVRDRMETTRQRAFFGLWRTPLMNQSLKYGLPVAAGVLVVIIGNQLIGGSNPGGPAATETPQPTVSSEPTASTSAEGSLPVGPYVMGSQLHGEDRVTVTIPAPGWFAPDELSVTKDLGGGDSVTVVVLPGDHYTVPRNICNWQIDDVDQRDPRFAQSANELVAFITEQTYDWPDGSLTREFSTPEDITIDGSHGQRIVDVAAAYPDSDPIGCDEQQFCTLQDRDGWGCLLSHPEPGALDTLWVVDPPDGRNYRLVVASSGTPDAGLRAEMNTLVNSMVFSID